MWGTVACLWDSQGVLSSPLILEEVMKRSVAAYAHRLAPSPEQEAGQRPCQDVCQAHSPRSVGRARELRTLPAEANQFFWQVEAGVDLGAISREQAGAGKRREQLPLCPHIHTRLGIQDLGKGHPSLLVDVVGLLSKTKGNGFSDDTI